MFPSSSELILPLRPSLNEGDLSPAGDPSGRVERLSETSNFSGVKDEFCAAEDGRLLMYSITLDSAEEVGGGKGLRPAGISQTRVSDN